MTARYFWIDHGGMSAAAGFKVSSTDGCGWILSWIADFARIEDARAFVWAAGQPDPKCDPRLAGEPPRRERSRVRDGSPLE